MAPQAAQGPADAMLYQAIALHRAGRLAEAEQLYRRVLAARPDFAEVHVNLGVVLMFRGAFDAAAAACRAGIALKPDYPKGHYHLGDVLSVQNRLDEAAEAYRAAIARRGDYAEAHNNLANVLMRLDRPEEAAASYRATIALRPDFWEAHAGLGNALLRQDRLEDAIACYRKALMLNPAHVEALGNLGTALGRLSRLDEAVAACRRAIALRPGYAVAHATLGSVLKTQGHLDEAETCCRRALALQPALAEAYLNLGAVLCEKGATAEGFGFLTRYAELSYAGGAKLAPGPVIAHKQRHDREQRAWLGLAEDDERLHLADGSAVQGPAVNRSNAVAGISMQWRSANPQLVVIDDLLTPQALEKLRHFCLASTFWRQVHDGGYLGAMPEHGFASPLLAQIAEELRQVYPAIIGDHPLLHLWGFKYDSSLRGIGVHADFAAVNVNFWITPDEANLDPDSGGLRIWDAAAPLDWDFARYNAAGGEIRAFLAGKNAKYVTIPYRANRAVIFDSDLFHETDTIRFKPGYENRRINVTLLYGRRQPDRPR